VHSNGPSVSSAVHARVVCRTGGLLWRTPFSTPSSRRRQQCWARRTTPTPRTTHCTRCGPTHAPSAPLRPEKLNRHVDEGRCVLASRRGGSWSRSPTTTSTTTRCATEAAVGCSGLSPTACAVRHASTARLGACWTQRAPPTSLSGKNWACSLRRTSHRRRSPSSWAFITSTYAPPHRRARGLSRRGSRDAAGTQPDTLVRADGVQDGVCSLAPSTDRPPPLDLRLLSVLTGATAGGSFAGLHWWTESTPGAIDPCTHYTPHRFNERALGVHLE
jgi:hypothetical protein